MWHVNIKCFNYKFKFRANFYFPLGDSGLFTDFSTTVNTKNNCILMQNIMSSSLKMHTARAISHSFK